MNALLHYATCPGWVSGELVDCTCLAEPAWRIRKDPEEKFPWRISRRTSDLVYEPMMGCSTHTQALSIVNQMIWLRANAIQVRR